MSEKLTKTYYNYYCLGRRGYVVVVRPTVITSVNIWVRCLLSSALAHLLNVFFLWIQYLYTLFTIWLHNNAGPAKIYDIIELCLVMPKSVFERKVSKGLIRTTDTFVIFTTGVFVIIDYWIWKDRTARVL